MSLASSPAPASSANLMDGECVEPRPPSANSIDSHSRGIACPLNNNASKSKSHSMPLSYALVQGCVSGGASPFSRGCEDEPSSPSLSPSFDLQHTSYSRKTNSQLVQQPVDARMRCEIKQTRVGWESSAAGIQTKVVAHLRFCAKAAPIPPTIIAGFRGCVH